MAKCEHCHENEADFFKHTNINGHIEEAHLCLDCAEKLGYTHFRSYGAPNVYDRPSYDYFSRGFMQSRFLSFLNQDSSAERPTRSINPAVDPEIARMREINVLRVKMRDAAEREDFETAMELREQIKRMEVTAYE